MVKAYPQVTIGGRVDTHSMIGAPNNDYSLNGVYFKRNRGHTMMPIGNESDAGGTDGNLYQLTVTLLTP